MVAVVSQPDRGRGRGRRSSASPVARLALEAEVPLLRPERVGEPEVAEALRAQRPDLGVVVAFGQFLPRRIRELPRLGYLVNGHASLLPRWRGAAPVQHALLAGDEETGCCAMRVEREMDAGAVAGVAKLRILPDEDAGGLAARLSELTAELLARVVDEIAEGRAQWTPQEEEGVTLAPKIERADAQLDFRHPAADLVRRVRAMAPSPGAFTHQETGPLRVLAARTLPGPVGDAPGTVRVGGEAPLRIATADGWLCPLRLQRAGGRPLAVEEFQRGRGLRDGERLGNQPRPATLEA